MRYVIGVDGGGTETNAAVFSETSGLLAPPPVGLPTSVPSAWMPPAPISPTR